jgi:hypothetical protein
MHFSRSKAHAITEIVLFTFLPDADIKSSLSAADAIASRQEGIREMHWGRVEGDDSKVQFLASTFLFLSCL